MPGRGHAIEMDNLGEEENHQPHHGDIITSQETIGDEGSHHGELQEVIPRENLDAVDRTKQYPRQPGYGSSGAIGKHPAEDEDQGVKYNPKGQPGAEMFNRGGGYASFGGLRAILRDFGAIRCGIWSIFSKICVLRANWGRISALLVISGGFHGYIIA